MRVAAVVVAVLAVVGVYLSADRDSDPEPVAVCRAAVEESASEVEVAHVEPLYGGLVEVVGQSTDAGRVVGFACYYRSGEPPTVTFR